jgi:large subunit ribosomal protein L1
MTKLSKRFKEIDKLVDRTKTYSISDAVEGLKKCPPLKYDESVEISIKMGLDPKKADQQVRSTVALPNGTGKTIRVLVFAKGDQAKAAEEAGADIVGDDELLARVKGGWTEFDVVVATPDMMREVGKLGKILGPRGLMPTPKAGTVTKEVAKAVKEVKGGKIEFRLDRHAVINNMVGKLSFSKEQLLENIEAFLEAIQRMKPAGAKGQYIQGIALASTMGPGMRIHLRETANL